MNIQSIAIMPEILKGFYPTPPGAGRPAVGRD